MKYISIKFYTVCLLVVAFVSCSCTSPVDAGGQLLWQTSAAVSGLIEGEFPTVYYQGKVIVLGNQFSTKKSTLYCFDALTGAVLWKWSDWLIGDGRRILLDNVHTYGDIIVVSNGPFNYGIRLSDGKTVWSTTEVDRELSGNLGATGIGSKYFFPAMGQTLYMGLTESGRENAVITLAQATGPRAPAASVLLTGDTVVAFTALYGEAATNFRNKVYLILYNLTKRQLVYNLLQDTSSPENANVIPGGVPLIRDNRICSAIGRSVQCNDLETGRLLWRTKTEAPFTTSGIVEGDGIIFGNSSDGFMYAFDTQTGKLLWKVETYGTARRPFYMNGVVYVVSPGGGHLYALDGKTGAVIWKFTSPDDDGQSGSSFTGIVTGANGKIYVRSYLNLYCYKAAR
jgi:outer membrane protein assembly factor BamB